MHAGLQLILVSSLLLGYQEPERWPSDERSQRDRELSRAMNELVETGRRQDDQFGQTLLALKVVVAVLPLIAIAICVLSWQSRRRMNSAAATMTLSERAGIVLAVLGFVVMIGYAKFGDRFRFGGSADDVAPPTTSAAPMAVAPAATLPVQTLAEDRHLVGQERDDNELKMVFVWLPEGTFTMGSPDWDLEAQPNEKPQVNVTLTRDFWLGKFEVTQSDWERVMGTMPWRKFGTGRGGANLPANWITWEEAVDFCETFTASERRAGRLSVTEEYRLPTEAEWEYASRAGTTSRYSFGNDASALSEYAWWGGILGNENAENEPSAHPVGQKKANPWGLHDVHGNVYEWCNDWYDDKLAGGSDPRGPAEGTFRVYRGGSWSFVSAVSRSACRLNTYPNAMNFDFGFRVALAETDDDDAAPPHPLGHEELERLLASRVDGELGATLNETAKSLLAESHLTLGCSVGLTTPDPRIKNAILRPRMPKSYRPTLREFFDSIALATSSAWKYDPNGKVGRAPIKGGPVFEFERIRREKAFELTLTEGWEQHDFAGFVIYSPPVLSRGMDIYDMGTFSADDAVDEAQVFDSVRRDIALEWAWLVNEKAAAEDMRPAMVGAYEALHYDVSVSSQPDKTTRWRQWVFFVKDRCYSILSVIEPEFEDEVFPDVQAILASFRMKQLPVEIGD